MYLGKFEDPKIPRNHELFLEAKGIDEGTLRERLPRLLKIGSWTQIGYILNAAMPGVRVGSRVPPPGAIPMKPGVVYLRVDQAGDYWNDILGSGTIAIYQPIEPQKVDLRLIGGAGSEVSSRAVRRRSAQSLVTSAPRGRFGGDSRLGARTLRATRLGGPAHEPAWRRRCTGFAAMSCRSSCSSAARVICRRPTSCSAACSGSSRR
jgi:hypothetical protein